MPKAKMMRAPIMPEREKVTDLLHLDDPMSLQVLLEEAEKIKKQYGTSFEEMEICFDGKCMYYDYIETEAQWKQRIKDYFAELDEYNKWLKDREETALTCGEAKREREKIRKLGSLKKAEDKVNKIKAELEKLNVK